MSEHEPDEPVPDVTVIVPTYRRASLAMTLTGLANQTPPFTFELIVVDNDSTRSAESIVQSQADTIHGEVRYLHEPRTGSSYARNTAIAAARAPVIAWCDDTRLSLDRVGSTSRASADTSPTSICPTSNAS